MIKTPKYLLATILQISGIVYAVIGALYALVKSSDVIDYLGFEAFIGTLIAPILYGLVLVAFGEVLRLLQQGVDQLRVANGEKVEKVSEIAVFSKTAAPVAAPAAPVAPAAPAAGNFCPACGAAQPADAKFCAVCGNKF